MRKNISIISTVIFIILLILVGCAQPPPAPKQAEPSGTPAPAAPAAKPIELRFSDHNPPNGRISVKYIEPWAREIEKATNGRVKVTMFFGEVLNKGTESLTAVTGGITDLAWVVHGFFPGKFNLSSVMMLPFIGAPEGDYQGRKLSSAAINSLIFQELYETMPEIQAEYPGFKHLYNHVSMPYFLTTTKKPVTKMEDLQGMKLRELGGPPTEMWKLLGANPMLLGMTDVYDAAEKGVIDGAGLQWSAIGTFRFYEVFKYWTDMGTTLSTYSVVMNQNKWNSMPKDIQDAIMKVSGKWGAEYAGTKAYGFDLQQEVFDAMKKGNYSMEKVTLAPAEVERWKKTAGQPLWDSWVKDMSSKNLAGQKILDETLRIVKKYTN
jgi:TRAP-type C4-dicarboxylate transport system substrate-binding protein